MSEWEDKCTCTFSQKVVGDGCQHCNPELTIELQAEEIADLERQLEEWKEITYLVEESAQDIGHQCGVAHAHLLTADEVCVELQGKLTEKDELIAKLQKALRNSHVVSNLS